MAARASTNQHSAVSIEPENTVTYAFNVCNEDELEIACDFKLAIFKKFSVIRQFALLSLYIRFSPIHTVSGLDADR